MRTTYFSANILYEKGNNTSVCSTKFIQLSQMCRKLRRNILADVDDEECDRLVVFWFDSCTYFGKLLSFKLTQALSVWRKPKESDTEHSLCLSD